MSVNAAAGGALMGKSIEAAKALLEEMVSNNYHWSSERTASKQSSGIYGVDVVDLLASKVDTLAQRFDRLGTPSLGSLAGSSSDAMFKVGALCDLWHSRLCCCLVLIHSGSGSSQCYAELQPSPIK